MRINQDRLARYFTELCLIESPSTSEAGVCRYLQRQFAQLGASAIVVDDSAPRTGSDTGNLLVRFAGDERLGAPLFFACHMDTVGPTDGIAVVRQGDVFASAGNTVLGADDKSGIAVLLELMALLAERPAAHCPIELLFTTCEEIGLVGAKAFDTGMLRARYGYALDSSKNGVVITGAPAANRLLVAIRGKAAHSGTSPEAGINALAIAAQALSRLALGRIDDLTTANFGTISGGTAINIIPEKVVLEGEVRSHSLDRLQQHTQAIEQVFRDAVANWTQRPGGEQAALSFEVREDYPLLHLDDKAEVLQRLAGAAARLGRTIGYARGGGGSDANIFCQAGLPTAILPTGMTNVHSVREQVSLRDMVDLTELLHALVTGTR